ncbi:MAG TPA: ferritin-like domain-containing protein [Candidatus Saccharimonadales bacterium]|nr:ferritin-like domain-containing protein [Candidatus Saccharimonadales bacterium]
MLDGDLRKLLIAQIGNELAAHGLYMGISVYFDRQSLKRWGKLFRDQSIEEAQHAQRIMDFLTDNEIEFDLPALKAVSTRYPSALAAAQRALQSERDVAAQFDRMAARALSVGDHRGHQFLQWFIEEQVEEEAKLQAIVDLIDSGINLFQAEPLLGEFE